jgi:hypothetical protein
MYCISEFKHPSETIAAKPKVTSCDLGYEYSLEHWIELRLMVENVDEVEAEEVHECLELAA